MKKLFIAVVIVLGLVLAASIYFYVTLTQDKDTLTMELRSTQITLASTQAELASTNITLASTQQTLTSTQTELGTTRDTLSSTRSELDTTKDTLTSTRLVLVTTNQTLASTQSELATTKQSLTSAQQASSSLTATLTSTQQKLTVAQDTLRGLGMTIQTSVENYDTPLTDNASAKNPTFAELMAFLAKDKTENHTYILNVYDCSQYSQDVHNNAEAAGIRAAVMHITFRGETIGHACNAFLTTDYGLVYIDCTEAPDKIAYAITGKEFKAVDVNAILPMYIRNDNWWNSLSSYYYLAISTGARAIVSSIVFYW